MAVDAFYLNITHLFVTVALAMITGIALAMFVWIIPIIQLSPTTASKLQQFELNITLGGRYQQTGSRLCALLLAGLAYLSYAHDDAALQQRAKYYAATLSLLLPIAPYEIFLVFPYNDQLIEWGATLQRDGKRDFSNAKDKQVATLLWKWRTWHTGRIVAPLMATSVLVWCALVT